MRKVAFHTLGCKVNQYDTEAICEMFTQRGFTVVEFDEPADVYIINTCAVTQAATQKSRQIIRRAARSNPDALVIVTGCYAQVAPEEAAVIEGVDIITGSDNRSELPRIASDWLDGKSGAANRVGDIMSDHSYEPLSVTEFRNRTRAYIKIQDGCENFCAYCVIPYARGPIRSRNLDEIVAEAGQLAEKGYCEIVLTGIHLASYGKDLGNGTHFMDAAERIAQIEGIKRIRLGSIEPSTVDEEFVRRAKACGILCPHFHVSLQSGSNTTLARMNRKYTAGEYAGAVAKLRAAFPDMALTTDVMVGFPGESEAEFHETLEFLKEMRFAKTHIFMFSPRKGTPAAGFGGQVPKAVKEKRAAILAELDDQNVRAFQNKFSGTVMTVLTEQGGDICNGLTSNYIHVDFTGENAVPGELVPVLITGEGSEGLTGKVHR